MTVATPPIMLVQIATVHLVATLPSYTVRSDRTAAVKQTSSASPWLLVVSVRTPQMAEWNPVQLHGISGTATGSKPPMTALCTLCVCTIHTLPLVFSLCRRVTHSQKVLIGGLVPHCMMKPLMLSNCDK